LDLSISKKALAVRKSKEEKTASFAPALPEKFGGEKKKRECAIRDQIQGGKRGLRRKEPFNPKIFSTKREGGKKELRYFFCAKEKALSQKKGENAR